MQYIILWALWAYRMYLFLLDFLQLVKDIVTLSTKAYMDIFVTDHPVGVYGGRGHRVWKKINKSSGTKNQKLAHYEKKNKNKNKKP